MKSTDLFQRLQHHWILSRGVQSFLLRGSADVLRRLAQTLDTAHPPNRTSIEQPVAPLPDSIPPLDSIPLAAFPHPSPTAGSYPTSADEVRALIRFTKASLDHLDDVHHYVTIGELDNDLYALWKDLERKMQRHRQSEAKYQLKDMFTI